MDLDESRQHEPEFDVRPASVRRIRVTELERRAVAIGTLAGKALVAAREARRILEKPGSRADRLDELRSVAWDRTANLRQAMSARAAEWRRTAWDRSAGVRSHLQRGYERSRQRTEQAGRDYPFHILTAAGVAGFLLGALLGSKVGHER